MTDLHSLAWVALGSALGGLGRYLCTVLVTRFAGTRYPWGTLTVNTAGSFLLGLASGLSDQSPNLLPLHTWTFLMLGVCGSFTTVSSFSLETLDLLRSGEWQRATVNVLLSLQLCLMAVAGGLWVGLRSVGG